MTQSIRMMADDEDMTTAADIAGPLEGMAVLVLDAEARSRSLVRRVLAAQGARMVEAHSAREALSVLGDEDIAAAIIQVESCGDDADAVLASVRRGIGHGGLLISSEGEAEELAVVGIECGADAVLQRPLSPKLLLHALIRLAELRRERTRAADLEQDLKRTLEATVLPGIITQSDAMRTVLKVVERAAQRDSAVLISGESGTGKEFVARAIHSASRRSSGPFVEINCAAMPANLIEGELFGAGGGGHDRNFRPRASRVERAAGGTLFVDEIGDMPLAAQDRLLAALAGGGADLRLISATNRDLVADVRAGRFREDLLSRIAVVPVRLPALRERPEDIELLLEHFLRQEGHPALRLTAAARMMLMRYTWPGNVRELRNFAHAAARNCDGPAIDDGVVSRYFGTRVDSGSGVTPLPLTTPIPLIESPTAVRTLAEIERDEIMKALRVFRGDVSEAANALGMGRATLYKYIKKEDIDLARFE